MKSRARVLAVRLALLAFPAAVLPASAQERETRDLAGFDAIAVGGGIDLFLRQGERLRVDVSAPDGELNEIVTEVVDGKLDIRRRRPAAFFDWGDHGYVSVILPKLTGVTASGGSDVETEGAFSGDTLALVASGGSDMAVNVAVTSLEVTASGGSDVRLTGTAREAQVQSSGGSDVDASALTVDEADVNSSGGSDLSIAVRQKIVANASGGSDIRYTGQPTVVTVNASGGGGVQRR